MIVPEAKVAYASANHSTSYFQVDYAILSLYDFKCKRMRKPTLAHMYLESSASLPLKPTRIKMLALNSVKGCL
jgi:hypothetical protein